MSDIHLEFRDEGDYPEIEGNKDHVLILAGDIGVVKRKTQIVNWLEYLSPNFKAILMVAGNHEFYRGSIHTTIDKLKKLVVHIPNVHIIENELVNINGIRFLGCTLWTNYINGNPLAMNACQMGINDHKKIRMGNEKYPYMRKLTTDYLLHLHNKSIDFLRANILPGDIVITHHAPLYASLPSKFLSSSVNSGFVSDLSELILDTNPAFWIHGHLHNSANNVIGNTNVIANPFGYKDSEENRKFDPNASFTV